MSCDLLLTERRARECRLSSAEAEYLLAHHRAHLDLVPLGGRWRVTPLGIAGVIALPTRRIIVRPRIPEANLAWLLGLRECRSSAFGEPVLEMAASLLAQSLDETAAAGLARGYREHRSHGSTLTGTLDAAAQMRASPASRAVLHAVADAQTAALPCNVVPLALGRILAASAWLSPSSRAALSSSLVPWHEAGDRPLSAELVEEMERSPAPPRYAPLLGACRALLASHGVGSSLLISLERVWERHLERLAARAVEGIGECFAQRMIVACPADGDRPEVAMRPDAMVYRNGSARLALDAKWKRVPASAVVTDDFYQALAYAAALGTRKAMLVHPGRNLKWDFDLAGVRVMVRSVPISGELARCRRAERRLEREVRAACRSHRRTMDVPSHP